MVKIPKKRCAGRRKAEVKWSLKNCLELSNGKRKDAEGYYEMPEDDYFCKYGEK